MSEKIFFIFLLICQQSFSQDIVQKKDGSKIVVAAGSIHVEVNRNRIVYSLKDDKKEYHLKFTNLDYASYGDVMFKSFLIGDKIKGYFVLAQDAGKTLALNKDRRVKSAGGFESTYIHYDLIVLDANNNSLEMLAFTDDDSDKSIGNRGKIIPMIKRQFDNCKKLLDRTALFESPPSDTKNATILVFINSAAQISCN